MRCSYLASNRLNDSGEIMVLPLTRLLPRSEVPQLAIIPIIGKPHLWAYKQNLLVMNNDTTIVDHVLVNNGPFKSSVRQVNRPRKELSEHTCQYRT